MPSDGNTWTNFKTHFTADKINYKKARPVDTTAQHRYTNQVKIIEKVLQEIETGKQHEAAFAEELDIHKDIEALKQQLALPHQQEANESPDKTKMQILTENVNYLKAKMNNNKEKRAPNGNRKLKL